MDSDSPILRVEGLSKRFGAFEALAGLSFTVGRGETVGLLGRNGAGKSTTLKLLCGLLRPSAGGAWLDGASLLERGAHALRRALGAVVEAPRFYPQLSGRRNLGLPARLLGVSPQRVEALLARVGLSERAGVPFGSYSMGMKQRLGLAAAFLHAPRLVILDEPTGGLDPVGQRQVRALIRSLARDEGVSVLLCSHLLDEVAELCDRALVLERGRLMLEQALASPGDIAPVAACFDRLAAGEEGLAAPPPAGREAVPSGAGPEEGAP